jgi:hypothetical protein
VFMRPAWLKTNQYPEGSRSGVLPVNVDGASECGHGGLDLHINWTA